MTILSEPPVEVTGQQEDSTSLGGFLEIPAGENCV
jgi:hypothetical protein